jgi:hypothetical protein
MYRMLLTVVLGVAAVLSPSDYAHSEVIKKPCPFTCKSAGFKKKKCKDWKEADMCFVEVAKKGNVHSGECPKNCKSMGIPKKKCKDWKEGNTCYVRDLR